MRAEILSMGRSSLVYGTGQVLLRVMLQANRYVIQVERGLDDVGIYAIGFNLGYAISIVVSGFTSAWFPFYLAYGDRQDEPRRLWIRYAVTNTRFLILAATQILDRRRRPA
jgi:O-antigen/teichoic acid export membrane protein